MIRLDDVHVSYGKLEVLRGVSLEIEEKGFVSLIGANGAGKSTALKAIVGLIGLDRGSIELDGSEIGKLSTKERLNKGIAYVPQGGKVFSSMSVRENLELVSDDFGDVVGLFPNIQEKLSLQAGSLSGGEQQMLCIARSLLLKPKYLLLDEPSVGLSPIFVKTVFETIREINKKGIGILVVEQNVKKALEYSDHGYLLEQGVVKKKVTKKDLADQNFSRVYLGV